MKKIKELLQKGYKVDLHPMDDQLMQVIVVQTKTKERGYFSKALYYDDKKAIVSFENRLEDMLETAQTEIEKAEKEQREKIAASKKQQA